MRNVRGALRVDRGVSAAGVDVGTVGVTVRLSADGIEWDERLTRSAVKARSGGLCEWCGKEATDMHHRVNKSQGGWWSPANIAHLCRADHQLVTAHPKWAKDVGLSVEPFTGGEHTDPAQHPIRVIGHGADLWLTDQLIAKGARA